MIETETKVTPATNEASNTNSPVTESKLPISVNPDEDIPAVDADVKDSDTVEPKKVEAKEKVPESRKDPREDPVAWVNSLIPGAVHKVNYRLLDWAQQLAIEEEDKRQMLPGRSDAVTKNQFLSFLRDGSLLAKLANRLQPGTVETIHEGDAAKDKTNQTSNINAFINFVKEKAGLSEEQVFTAADLQEKGKAGYQAVFNTLMQLALKAQGIFEQKGIDVEQLVQTASQVVPTNLVQTILNFFRRAQPIQTPKKLAKEAEEKDKATTVEKVVEEKQAGEEQCKKVDTQAGSVDTPAVAVH
ncbi:hypothetical protein LOAG_07907 [Loa loa]|uniref:Calponin-homology (CH) domain-containing protein n=1 Tax=Loa loa TaxID=7209 RepID=A0A1S0TUU4_LOALO|nr:hypothetical protein LOAG_07907 [Loa loa]EFO20584.2 hypothetical protein LOAG_07907 [Loa loa]